MAGGAWSSLFLRATGCSIPQLSVLASVAATEPMPEIFPGNAADDDFAFRRRPDGGYSHRAGGASMTSSSAPMPFATFGAYLPVLKKDFRVDPLPPGRPAGLSRRLAHAAPLVAAMRHQPVRAASAS